MFMCDHVARKSSYGDEVQFAAEKEGCVKETQFSAPVPWTSFIAKEPLFYLGVISTAPSSASNSKVQHEKPCVQLCWRIS